MRYRIQIYNRDPSGKESCVSIRSLDYHPDFLARLEELGIVEIKDDFIDSQQLQRLERLCRLRSSLGVNFSGAAIILDLLDRIEELTEEIRKLSE